MSYLHNFDQVKFLYFLGGFQDRVKENLGKNMIYIPILSIQDYGIDIYIRITKKKRVEYVLGSNTFVLGNIHNNTNYINIILDGLQHIQKCSSCEEWKQNLSDGICHKCVLINSIKLPEECQHTDCCICYDPLTLHAVFRTSCNHFFHYKCLKKIIPITFDEEDPDLQFISCPLCRNEVCLQENEIFQSLI